MFGLDPQIFQIGLDGFVWFVGIVESVLDPLNVGRMKVRILGWHEINDPDGIPEQLSTNDLPWAMPLKPVTHAHMPCDLRVRDWVLGFYMDGRLGQQPVILGAFPSIRQKADNG